MKRLIKKIIRALLCLWTFILIFIPNVKAEIDTQYELKLLGRNYNQLPFTTGYGVGEVTYYTNELKIYGTNVNLLNLPKYLYFVYCATGSLDINTTNVYYGGITHQGATKGASCTVIKDGNYYSGDYYLDRWTITSWADYSSSGVYEFGVQWRGYPINNASYYNAIRGESVFLSNELITDFASDTLLQSLISSNGSINDNISSIKSDTNSLKSGQNEIKQNQVETNEKLDDLNDNIISESDDYDSSSCGIICKLKKIPSKIGETFTNVLRTLFLPDEDYFSDWFDDLKDFIELKLGFLSLPFTLLIDFVNSYLNLNPSSDIIINIPNITVPNFDEHTIISAQTFNWSQLLNSKESLRSLWTLYLDFIDVFLILNFIGLCSTIYARIFGGDVSNYEYYTVEDSITYDNDTGEVTGTRHNERVTQKRRV
jgi:hypothetical protein